jgi:hypothetical protein
MYTTFSQPLTPDTPSISTRPTCCTKNHVRSKLLREHGELGFVLVHAYVSPAHATLSIKSRAAMEYTVVVED